MDMKTFAPYLIILLVGVGVGWLCHPNHFRDATKMSKVDTVTVYETAYYSRLELAKNTYRLDVPKVEVEEFVYVPSDSVEVVYKDSIRYVMLPREYRYTKMDDVEIWHSGVDSTIDSLNVSWRTVIVTQTETVGPKRNRVALGMEASYSSVPYIPLYLEYGRKVHPNLEVYGRVFYDMPRTVFGAGMGVRTTVEW